MTPRDITHYNLKPTKVNGICIKKGGTEAPPSFYSPYGFSYIRFETVAKR